MIKKISSLQHPLVKHLVRLKKDTAYRKEKKSLLLEGFKPIKELWSTCFLQSLLIIDPYKIPQNILCENIYLVTEEIIKKISCMQNPEGIIAEIDQPPFTTLPGQHFILALDSLSDPGNLGTLLRTALAFKWEGAFLIENSVDPFNDKALRAARGATFRLPMMQGSWVDLEEFAQKNQFEILVADIEGPPINSFTHFPKSILVLGNEARGPSLNKKNYKKVSIPMPGEMESLNVAIAGGILMHSISSLKEVK